MSFGRIGGKALTAELRKLAAQAVSVDDDGNPVTREMRLADLIWKQALGYTETLRDEMGTETKREHTPVAWAQQFLWDRLEGKSPVAAVDNEGSMKASDKVRQLAKDRINGIAAKVVPSGPPKKTGTK
jgi:hypothetical protein